MGQTPQPVFFCVHVGFGGGLRGCGCRGLPLPASLLQGGPSPRSSQEAYWGEELRLRYSCVSAAAHSEYLGTCACWGGGVVDMEADDISKVK